MAWLRARPLRGSGRSLVELAAASGSTQCKTRLGTETERKFCSTTFAEKPLWARIENLHDHVKLPKQQEHLVVCGRVLSRILSPSRMHFSVVPGSC